MHLGADDSKSAPQVRCFRPYVAYTAAPMSSHNAGRTHVSRGKLAINATHTRIPAMGTQG